MARGAFLVVFLARLHAIWADRALLDDAYISFRYAQNLVAGHGLVFNPGELVEGYTNFLWVLISAVPLLLGASDPGPFSHWLGLALFSASILLIKSLLSLLCSDERVALILTVPFLFFTSFCDWFFLGMEVGLLVTLLLLSLRLLAAYSQPGAAPRSPSATLRMSLALLGILTMLTRLDHAVFVAPIAIACLVVDWRAGNLRRFVLQYAAPLAGGVGAYLGLKTLYFGSFFPNTYYAKLIYLGHYERGAAYLTAFAQSFHVLWMLPLLVTALVLAQGPLRAVSWAACSGACLSALYLLRIGGDFMEWRFAVNLATVFVFLSLGGGFLGAEWLWTRMRLPRRGARASLSVAAILAVAAITLLWHSSPFAVIKLADGQLELSDLKLADHPRALDLPTSGRMLRDKLPPGLVLATTMVGMLGYYCDCQVLDLHGLTDHAIGRLQRDAEVTGMWGHELVVSDVDAMRRRGANALVIWPDLFPTETPAAHGVAAVTGVTAADGVAAVTGVTATRGVEPTALEYLSLRRTDGYFFNVRIIDPDYRKATRAALKSDPTALFAPN